MTANGPIGQPPVKRWNRRLKRALITTLLLIIGAIGNQAGWFDTPKKSLEQNQPGMYQVTRFDDGDTIEVDMNGQKEKIRMIGVDTPETKDPRKNVQCFGKAASEFTKNLIGSSKLRLESDSLSSNRDRYNRLLRYVYLTDGRLVNLELIAQGYGFAYTGFPFTKSDEFVTAQKTARDNNLGLWKECTPTTNQYGGLTSNDAE